MLKKVAFIPARSGSKRIPNKNIKILGGQPLIAHTIRPALESREFDDIICITDSEHYAEIAKSYGASVPFLRDTKNSGDTSPDREWLNETLLKLKRQGRQFDVFAILRPTSPFRSSHTINRAVNEFLTYKNIDSLRAVEKCSQHPGKMWVKQNKTIQPLMPFTIDDTPWHSSQYAALPEILIQNASLEICWTKSFLETGQISGETVVPFYTTGYEGFDINNDADWILAETVIAQLENDKTHNTS